MPPRIGAPPARCRGTTKRGSRCSLTSESSLLDECGRAAAEPLRRGGDFCLFHARPFCFRAAELRGAVVVFLDFETTGLDVARDRIVEIGAAASNGNFSTVVSPGIPSSSAVHGIEEEELVQGPAFPTAWMRFVTFAEGLANAAVQENSGDSEDDSPRLLRPPDEPPVVLLAAHNGERFDYAMLLCECSRHGISWAPLERWCFVDTLWVLRAMASVESISGCFKLQCMVRCTGGSDGLLAHRALDDCICLRGVMECAAARLGVSLPELLTPFAVRLDVSASAAQVSVLLDPTRLMAKRASFARVFFAKNRFYLFNGAFLMKNVIWRYENAKPNICENVNISLDQ